MKKVILIIAALLAMVVAVVPASATEVRYNCGTSFIYGGGNGGISFFAFGFSDFGSIRGDALFGQLTVSWENTRTTVHGHQGFNPSALAGGIHGGTYGGGWQVTTGRGTIYGKVTGYVITDRGYTCSIAEPYTFFHNK